MKFTITWEEGRRPTYLIDDNEVSREEFKRADAEADERTEQRKQAAHSRHMDERAARGQKYLPR